MNAPGTEPMPPKTAAVNALIPGMEPVYGDSVGYAEHSSTPAIAARPEPMAKVREIVLIDIDTHQLRGVFILGNRQHRLSGLCLFDKCA